VTDDGFTIVVVPDQGCPRCGTNGSPKVTDAENRCWWKCLGPDCTVGYWLPETGEIEERATPEEAREMAARIKAEVDEMMRGRHFEEYQDPRMPEGVKSFRLVPDKEAD
jgi:hypothetical protein